MSDRFAAPSEASALDMNDIKDHLLVIKVHSLEVGVKTIHGEKEAIKADVHDISTQTSYTDVLLFGGFLIGGLRNRVGQEVLAVLYQGVAQKGQNAPWLLTKDAAENPQYVAAAVAYMDARAAQRFASAAPAAAVTPPAPPMPANHLMAPPAAPVAPVATAVPAAVPVAAPVAVAAPVGLPAGFDPASMTPEQVAALQALLPKA
jgi:hypothetical protein